jgi:glycerophosphoryl diester phosphodiesterase
MTTERDKNVSSPPAARVPARPPLVIGHRGASRAHPENTLAAFAGAAALGAEWVELDVRRTADGVLVVHHDPVLPDGRVIVETARADLPVAVPTLTDALATCATAGLGVNVEIKSDPRDPDYDPEHRVAAEVASMLALDATMADGRPRHLVTSFDPQCLDRVRAVAPSLRTGQLAFNIDHIATLMDRTRGAGHVAVNPWDPFVDESFMALARAAGLEVYPWTVDDPDRMRALVALGVDGIITNVPDVLRAILDESPSS